MYLKDLILKCYPKVFLQITIFFNKPGIIRSTGSTEKIFDREKFEFFPEKRFIQPKKTVKASNNNGLVNSANCNIFSPNRNENLEGNG